MNDDWLNVPIATGKHDPTSPPTPPPQSAFPWVQLERWLPWLVALGVVLAWFVSSRRSADDGKPIAVSGLRVLIVEESADRQTLPPEQSKILTSVPIRETVAQLGGQIRVMDADDSAEAISDEWRALRKRITTTPPAVVFAKPRRAQEMPLPANVDEFRAKLEAFAQ